MRAYIFSLAFLVFLACCQNQNTVDYDSLSEDDKHQAKHALSSFTVADGLEVELFASEPMLVSPSNMDVDHRGRVWVCEILNYRLPYNQTNKGREAGDRILILEDTDGDGKADNRKVFYQGSDINAALGIGVFDNKVIVSASPMILILTDTDRDDVADKKDTLFAGISGIDDDHGSHALTFGPDGRFYFNFGNAGKQIGDKFGNILSDKWGRKITTDGTHFRQGLAFRCEEDGTDLEVLGHNFRNNFEITVDSYGNLVQSDNDDDGNEGVRINYLIEGGNYGYQDQITGAGWRTRRANMHQEIPKRHWHLNDPGVIPNMLQTGSGSPSGIAFYEGDLLPAEYRGQPIHAEPGHQVVRAYLMQPQGAGYTATTKNILKSDDKWFRPSDVTVAPDGSLFVCDWYDAVVGGNGQDDTQRGRIYRIAPDASRYVIDVPDVGEAKGAIAALGSANGSARYLGWHALKSPVAASIEVLAEMAESSQPHLRSRALWRMAKLPGREDEAILQALADQDERVVLAAIRMVRQLKGERAVDFLASRKLDFDSPAVRREVTSSIRQNCSPAALHLWSQLAQYYDGTDRWELETLGLATDACPDRYFDAWMRLGVINRKAQEDMIWRIKSAASVDHIRNILADEARDATDLARFVRALHFKPREGQEQILREYLLQRQNSKEALRDAWLTLDKNVSVKDPTIRRVLSNRLDLLKDTPEWFEVIALLGLSNHRDQLWSEVLGGDEGQTQRQALATLVTLGESPWIDQQLGNLEPQLYLHVVDLLGSGANQERVDLLVQQLDHPHLDLATQKAIVNAMGRSWDGQHELYDMIKANQLHDELIVPATLHVMNSWDSKIRNEGPAILASVDRRKYAALPDIVGLSRKTGDAAAGKGVFEMHCSTCHQVNGIGIRYGPDLSLIGSKLSKRGLYQAIVYPSASINFGFEGVQLETENGERYQGYIESETAANLLLRLQDGTTRTFNQRDLKQVEKMTMSLMTEGLHHTFSQEELIDLVTYLSSLQSTEAI